MTKLTHKPQFHLLLSSICFRFCSLYWVESQKHKKHSHSLTLIKMKMRQGCVPLYPALLAVTVLLFLSPTIAWCPWPHNKTKVQLDSIFGDSKKFESSSEFVHLKYHMGPVLTANITVHTIWYGMWQCSQKKIIREFINSISAIDSRHSSVSGWWSTVYWNFC